MPPHPASFSNVALGLKLMSACLQGRCFYQRSYLCSSYKALLEHIPAHPMLLSGYRGGLSSGEKNSMAHKADILTSGTLWKRSVDSWHKVLSRLGWAHFLWEIGISLLFYTSAFSDWWSLQEKKYMSHWYFSLWVCHINNTCCYVVPKVHEEGRVMTTRWTQVSSHLISDSQFNFTVWSWWRFGGPRVLFSFLFFKVELVQVQVRSSIYTALYLLILHATRFSLASFV